MEDTNKTLIVDLLQWIRSLFLTLCTAFILLLVVLYLTNKTLLISPNCVTLGTFSEVDQGVVKALGKFDN